MKVCQIMTYGGKTKWIELAHRKDSNIKWFIFVGAIKEELPEYFERIEPKIKQLKALQEDFPESEKIRYSYIEIKHENDLVQLIRYFRALINFINKKNFQISCNLTAGMFELRIALYLASQIESDKILEIFYFNKQNFEKNLLFKSIKISEKGKTLLKILFKNIEEASRSMNLNFDEIEYNLSQIKNMYEKNGLNIDLPSLSRLVSKLIEDGYLRQRREGRHKYISLTDIGLIFCPLDNNLLTKIQKDLNESF
ncbi:MAG: winged helix-turn-helix domain-containing protein [Promethearchaeota archaeon]